MDKKRSKTNSPEAAIGSVINNIDLVFEIFLKLPVISLIRFKLGSKTWLSLITDPEFGITHSRRNTIESPVSDFYYQDRKRELSIFLHNRSSVPALKCLDQLRQDDLANSNNEIVQSCKGLILLIQWRTWCPIVLNPTTQKYKLITPPFDPIVMERRKCDLLLAFEPLKSHHYKIVIFLGHFNVYIFSSQSESWKEVSVTDSPAEESTRRIYWNGAIHYLNCVNIHMKFDLDTEKMIEIPLPPTPKILWRDKTKYFGESNGRLFLIQCLDSGALGFRMLEFDRNTFCWDIKHQFNLRPMVSQFPEVLHESESNFYEYAVLYVKAGAEKKSCSLLLAIPGKVVLFDVRKGKRHTNMTVIHDLPDDFQPWGEYSKSFHPYIQSLAPV